jgi:hypothetical protein
MSLWEFLLVFCIVEVIGEILYIVWAEIDGLVGDKELQ